MVGKTTPTLYNTSIMYGLLAIVNGDRYLVYNLASDRFEIELRDMIIWVRLAKAQKFVVCKLKANVQCTKFSSIEAAESYANSLSLNVQMLSKMRRKRKTI